MDEDDLTRSGLISQYQGTSTSGSKRFMPGIRCGGATYADLVSVDVIIVRTVVVHVLSVHHTSVWRYTQDYRPKTSFSENRHGAERFRP